MYINISYISILKYKGRIQDNLGSARPKHQLGRCTISKLAFDSAPDPGMGYRRSYNSIKGVCHILEDKNWCIKV